MEPRSGQRVEAAAAGRALRALKRIVASIGGDKLNRELEKMMLKRISLLVAAGAFVALLAPSAQAMTPAPLGSTTDVIQIAGGCGPGFYRGPYGGCRPMAGRSIAVCRSVRTPYGWRRVCR